MPLLLGDVELDLTDRVTVLGPDAPGVTRLVTYDPAEVVAAVAHGTVWWSAPGPVGSSWCSAAARSLALAGVDPRRAVLDDRLDLVAEEDLAALLPPGPPPDGPSLGIALPDGIDEAGLVAALVLAVRAGRRVVRTADPLAARRCLDVWEVLHREAVGRFVGDVAPGGAGESGR